MASIKTNLPEVRRALRELPRALDLRRRSPLTADSLGMSLLLRVAWAIRLRSLRAQTDPQGRPFAPLSPAYRRWKVKRGLDPRIDIATGKMLALREILGETRISSTSASMTYGLSADEIQKAEWAHEGSPRRHRPARPFYDLGEAGERALEAQLDAALDATIGGL